MEGDIPTVPNRRTKRKSKSVDSRLNFGNDEERDSRGVFYDSRGLLHKQELLKRSLFPFY